MGTVERGESNLSFQNIARVATTLGIPLSTLFLDIEAKARIFGGHGVQKDKESPRSTKARVSKRTSKVH